MASFGVIDQKKSYFGKNSKVLEIKKKKSLKNRHIIFLYFLQEMWRFMLVEKKAEKFEDVY